MSDIRSAWPDYPDYRIDLVPCRGIARVRVGDVVLAESTSAVRLIETDHVERLYFPKADVRLELLEDNEHHTVCPFKGRASYWSYVKEEPVVENLFWTYPDPFAEVAGILGYLGVYHEKTSVEVETVWPDGASAVSRFPLWGDQDDLLTVLDSRPAGPGRFLAPGYHERSRNVVEGGQLMGQAIVAASRAVPDQRVTWASMTFSRPANFDGPVELHLDVARRGRTFSTIAIRSEQGGKLIAPSLVLMDAGADDCIRQTVPMPLTPGPADALAFDMRVSGRGFRSVDGAYSDEPDRVGPPVIDVWARFRDNPAELALRQALVAQATTHWAIAAAMRPHPGVGQSQAHVSLSTGPVALTVAFHDDAPLDEWFLYRNSAFWSGRGLIQGEGQVYAEGGALIASYSLQAMVREMLAAEQDKGYATAM
jgi:acyl-CoA thioesterase II